MAARSPATNCHCAMNTGQLAWSCTQQHQAAPGRLVIEVLNQSGTTKEDGAPQSYAKLLAQPSALRCRAAPVESEGATNNVMSSGASSHRCIVCRSGGRVEEMMFWEANAEADR